MNTRRGFMTGAIGLFMAPAIVRASSLMAIKPFEVAPTLEVWAPIPGPVESLRHRKEFLAALIHEKRVREMRARWLTQLYDEMSEGTACQT